MATPTPIQSAPVARQATNTLVPPPCELIPLVDGPEIYGAMEDALLEAKRYIYLTAWLLQPNAVLKGQTLHAILKKKAAAGVDVRVLLCDLDVIMAHLPKTRKGAAYFSDLGKQLTAEKITTHVSKLEIVGHGMEELEELASSAAGYPVKIASHHQKTLMMDGKKGPVGFCSGCDIVEWVKHPSTWHDASIMIKGNCGKGLVENFVDRWNAEAKDTPGFSKLATPAFTGDSKKCATVRTMPGTYLPTTDIKDAYLDAIRNAAKSIYLENQYLRDPDLGRALIDAVGRGVQVTIVLPTKPEEAELLGQGKDSMEMIPAKLQVYSQYRLLKALITKTPKAVESHYKDLKTLKDAPPKNLTIERPRVRNHPYIHAKVMIADEKLALIGSANGNGRSMTGKCDSEIDVKVTDEDCAKALRKKLDASLKGRLAPYDNAFIGEDEKVSRISKHHMEEFQRKINTALDTMAAKAAPAVAVGAGIVGIPLTKKLSAKVVKKVELTTLEGMFPGIEAALETSDTDDFRDDLTDAVMRLL